VGLERGRRNRDLHRAERPIDMEGRIEEPARRSQPARLQESAYSMLLTVAVFADHSGRTSRIGLFLVHPWPACKRPGQSWENLRAVLAAAGQESGKADAEDFCRGGKGFRAGTEEGAEPEGRGAPRVGDGRPVGRSISIWKRGGFWAGSPGGVEGMEKASVFV